MAGCCKLLGAGILCSYSCPCRSGHSVPVNLQEDNFYFLFCNFFFLIFILFIYGCVGSSFLCEGFL